ncbi:hypothetical protein F2Q70_00010899 [Brassica cretica]|uniref:Uncharacterized protein n=1 Tax=Brassica cretica TaxID=69181 RepID=A0A8S9MBX0_BRACR|nr:hypothetical protein F2Q70_00010899 [Brassica cretica]
MIDLLEAYQPWSNPGRPPRVPLPARAKKAGRQKLTRGRGHGFLIRAGEEGWTTEANAGSRPRVSYPRGRRRLDDISSARGIVVVDEVDGLEGQEELCFVNANGTWYKKEPKFQYHNNYQQKPFYNNQQGGYQSTQGQAGSSTSAPQEVAPTLCYSKSWSLRITLQRTLEMN